jgi:hypothetical protein
MFNYFNIGLNAGASHSFHTMRQQGYDSFGVRALNKLWYGLYGATSVLWVSALSLSVCLYVSLSNFFSLCRSFVLLS